MIDSRVKYFANKVSFSAVFALLVVLFVVTPLLLILFNSGQLSAAKWTNLWTSKAPELLWRTIKLATLVALLTTVLGVSTAWLLTRYRFFASKVLVWSLVLPLAIPTYVYADIYTRLFSDRGWFSWLAQYWQRHVIESSLLQGLQSLWTRLTGDDTTLSEFSDLLSVSLVLALASFPYVFLLVRAALNKSTKSLEEAARLQGADARSVFWRVNVPLLRPAIAAGLAIVVLHTISDFGAVSILQYHTFTSAIYLQYMRDSFDLALPAALSLILVVMALSFLVIERFFRSRQRYFVSDRALEPEQIKRLRGYPLFFAWCWIGLIALFAVVAPVALILVESFQAWYHGDVGLIFWRYVFNSFFIAVIVATVALIAAFPVAYYHTRRNSLYSAALMHMSNVGFILPGPVVAIGVSLLALLVFPQFSPMVFLLTWIVAVAVRYLPLASQAQESALQQVTPSMECAGRMLGATAWQNMRRVILPVIRPGLVSAWVLVFIDALKELPAALLLKPQGFETLPVIIWQQASEEMMEAAAPAALMLILATFPALWLMMKGHKSR